MKRIAWLFLAVVLLTVGVVLRVSKALQSRIPEHLKREIIERYGKEEDAHDAIESFLKNLEQYNTRVVGIQNALDRLGPVDGMIYKLGSKKERSADYERFEEWPILGQALLSKEAAESSRKFAHASTSYGADSYDCFLPGIGIEWRGANGRRVRQVICLSCKNLMTYTDNDPKPISLPLSEEAMSVWSELYQTYFPDSK